MAQRLTQPFQYKFMSAGPKLYNAFASKAGSNHGATDLHLDVTDAINIMMYSSGASGSAEARWEIVHRDDKDKLAAYLTEKYGPFVDGSHPIHAQEYYLNDTDLMELEGRGVRVYTIYQHVGEAVLIPAGCAHQVNDFNAK